LLAKESGCGGVVASPQEIGVVKDACGRDFIVVTPGIRLGTGGQGSGVGDDQARTLTPAEAAQAGADYIVVGRPIYEAPDPIAAIADIRAQLSPRVIPGEARNLR
jgi:orotidine-5'-phosphate decarboxylase